MQIIVTSQLTSNVVLKKFVTTAFESSPKPGLITGYTEICAIKNQTVIVVLPTNSKLHSIHDLYSDAETCKRFLSDYKVLDAGTGRHLQRMGDEILDVTPHKATIKKIAPPPEFTGRSVFHVTFSAANDNDQLYGTWLKWESKSDSRLDGPNGYSELSLCTGKAILEHFYLFFTLPIGYEAINPLCYIGSTNKPVLGKLTTNPVHSFELPESFPVFPEWRKLISSRQILRTRDDIPLDPFQEASLQIRMRSQKIVGKLSASVYFTGLGFALSINFLVCALFYLQDVGFTTVAIVECLIGICLSLITGYLGWRTITS